MQWRFHSRARGESAENRCSDEHLCKTPGPEDLANENSVESQEAEQSHGGGGGGAQRGIRVDRESLQHPGGQGEDLQIKSLPTVGKGPDLRLKLCRKPLVWRQQFMGLWTPEGRPGDKPQ